MKPKLKLRTNISIDFHHAIVKAAYTAIEDISNYPFANCINCLNFNEKKELCNLYNQRPPAKIIAYGCPQWEDLENIPF